MDLPHASSLSPRQTPVSVIIRCKTVKTSPLRIPYGTLKQQCVLIPLGSPTTVSKVSYVHAPTDPVTVPAMTCDPCMRPVRHRVGIQGGYTGWVVGRVIPVHPAGCSGSKPDSEAGPVASCRGAEWVVRCSGRPAIQGPPLPAVGPAPLSLDTLLEQDPTHGRLNLQNLRIMTYFSKVSQNCIVSPK